MPPGPPGLPILGNFLDVPKISAHEVYLNMRNEYGTLPSSVKSWIVRVLTLEFKDPCSHSTWPVSRW